MDLLIIGVGVLVWVTLAFFFIAVCAAAKGPTPASGEHPATGAARGTPTGPLEQGERTQAALRTRPYP